MSSYVFTNFKKNLGAKLENLPVDTLKLALFGSTYNPQRDGDCAYSVPTPAAPTLTQGGAGGPGARTEYYRVAVVNPAGTSIASAEASLAVTAGEVVTVTSPTNPGGSCTGYNVYAALTSGGETLQNLSPIPFGTNWTEPTTGLTTTGAAFPTSNTAQISGELATGNGYTQGGNALTGVVWGNVPANSWGSAWAPSTGYTQGQIVRPATANGFLYLCVGTGTSGAAAPAWGTSIGGITLDGSTYWLCLASEVTRLSANNVSWTNTAVLSFRWGVVYDATTGDLVSLIDLNAVQTSSSSGTINFNWDSAAGVVIQA